MCQEARKLVHQDVLDLVGLLDLDAYSDAVDARLDEDALVLVARNCQGRQQHLGRLRRLHLGDIVALGRLRRKVGETERCRQAAPDGLEIWAEGLRLMRGRYGSACLTGRTSWPDEHRGPQMQR